MTAVVVARQVTVPRVTRRAVAVLLLALLAALAVFGPMLAPYPGEIVVGPISAPPSADFLLGTDPSGMDVLSRTLIAARTDLAIAASAALLCTTAGIVLGLLAGMAESRGGFVGPLGRGIARGADLLDAVPAVLLGLVVVSFFGRSAVSIAVVSGLVLTPLQLRLVRAEVLRVRNDAYLDAARMAGMSELTLTVRHVLPNSIWAARENASTMMNIGLLLTSTLGFLGAGLPTPTPEWGAMLALGAADASVGRWWSALVPFLVLIAVGATTAWVGSNLWTTGRASRPRRAGLTRRGRDEPTSRRPSPRPSPTSDQTHPGGVLP